VVVARQNGRPDRRRTRRLERRRGSGRRRRWGATDQRDEQQAARCREASHQGSPVKPTVRLVTAGQLQAARRRTRAPQAVIAPRSRQRDETPYTTVGRKLITAGYQHEPSSNLLDCCSNASHCQPLRGACTKVVQPVDGSGRRVIDWAWRWVIDRSGRRPINGSGRWTFNGTWGRLVDRSRRRAINGSLRRPFDGASLLI